MLYSEKELANRLQSGCALFYFYAADEALVRTAANEALRFLNQSDPETTVLDGPHTHGGGNRPCRRYDLFFSGGKRLVLMPMGAPIYLFRQRPARAL